MRANQRPSETRSIAPWSPRLQRRCARSALSSLLRNVLVIKRQQAWRAALGLLGMSVGQWRELDLEELVGVDSNPPISLASR
jgi:hypothetical protein